MHFQCFLMISYHLFLKPFQPMLRTEHNGEGFHYLISYKRHDHPDAEEITHREYDWRQSSYKVSNQETYKEYEISVQAVNSMGSAQDVLEKKLGYSSEDSMKQTILQLLFPYSRNRQPAGKQQVVYELCFCLCSSDKRAVLYCIYPFL